VHRHNFRCTPSRQLSAARCSVLIGKACHLHCELLLLASSLRLKNSAVLCIPQGSYLQYITAVGCSVLQQQHLIRRLSDCSSAATSSATTICDAMPCTSLTFKKTSIKCSRALDRRTECRRKQRSLLNMLQVLHNIGAAHLGTEEVC
jgi:hypothetical protein